MSTGSTQLIDGVNKLTDGSGKVTDGLVKVNDGSGTLAEKLGEGAEKTGEVKGTDKTYDMFASPVKVKTEKMAEVPNYGTWIYTVFLITRFICWGITIIYRISITRYSWRSEIRI